MIETRKYTPADLEKVIAVFRSNIPKYFKPDEEAGLRNFLNNEPGEDYYVFETDREIVGAGGIALNENETVSLCWGMLRNDLIGIGLGKQMTQFRIDLAAEKYPGLPLAISTSQHTEGFYKRFGFRTTEHVKDGFGPGIDNCKMRLDPVGNPITA